MSTKAIVERARKRRDKASNAVYAAAPTPHTPETETVSSNYDAALKAEAKKVIRCFHHYSSETRANHASSHRLGYQQRQALGEFFYTHPAVPNRAFPTRKAAAIAGLRALSA